MLAGRLHFSPRELRMEEVPTPEPGPREVLVKVAAAGVCLSDVHLIDGTLRPAFGLGDAVTLGHEVAGTVAALGTDVHGWEVGARVVLAAGEFRHGVVLTRGVDYDGGWAEYCTAAASTLVAVPEGLTLEQACFVPDAVSTPWSAITATAQVRPAEACGVWGVGGLGAHAVRLLRLVGAAPIVAVDPSPAARARALRFGADHAFDPADPDLVRGIGDVTGGALLDVAFDFAGVAAVREQAVHCLRIGIGRGGGRLVLVGLTNQPLVIEDGTRFSFANQRVLGHYGSVATDLPQLLRLLELERLDLSASVSDVVPLADAPAAVARLQSGRDDIVRIVLRP